jgi:hypothetical protein
MQTETSSQHHADPKAILAQLAIPFDPSEVMWRVAAKSRDGKQGRVTPYADQRAYTDRLNQLVSPSGWTREYSVSSLSSLTRVKKDKVIQTGKVIVTCVVTLHGVGVHSGSGEEWADDDNAMTRAEAQAFKRACSCFGLGRYFYNFDEIWVPVDSYGQPFQTPTLPRWALPPTSPATKPAQTSAATQSNREAGSPSANHNERRGPIDQNLTREIEDFERLLGEPLYLEILKRAGRTERARDIPNTALQGDVLDCMKRASRGISRVRDLAERVGDTRFIDVLDYHRVDSVTKIPSLEVLKRLVAALESVAYPNVA